MKLPLYDHMWNILFFIETTPRAVQGILKEGLKMKDFSHPNVLTIIGVSLDAGRSPYVLMPFMVNGSVLSYLKRERQNLMISVEDDSEKVRLHLQVGSPTLFADQPTTNRCPGV